MAVVAVVLIITFGMSAITAATGFIELSSTTSTLALMLGLAVAIDYALFIVSRYRHELIVGGDGEEAAGRAVGTAGSAVVFAGFVFSGESMIKTMGFALAADGIVEGAPPAVISLVLRPVPVALDPMAGVPLTDH